jgi:hypothetical protein
MPMRCNSEVQQGRSEVHQWPQSTRSKLPGKEVADRSMLRVVKALCAIVPDGLDELHIDVSSTISCWMRASSRPINPCDGPVGVERPMEQMKIGWYVMLIRVARRSAVLPEYGVVLVVRYNTHSQFTVQFKPL